VLAAAQSTIGAGAELEDKSGGVRSIPAGAVVGYNGTFVATEPMRLALLAVGYADGLDRRLGNRFSLLVHGQRAPLVGPHQHGPGGARRNRDSRSVSGDEVVILERRGARRSRRSITRRRRGRFPGDFHAYRQRVARAAV